MLKADLFNAVVLAHTNHSFAQGMRVRLVAFQNNSERTNHSFYNSITCNRGLAAKALIG
jgi:hypothetical protein